MSTSNITSFQKKTKGKIFQIPGSRPSLHNNQLIVSSGVPSLDHVLGGGLAVGTVFLIEEDRFGSYSRLIVKYFLAEAIMSHHALFLASADVSPKQLIKELPGPLVDNPGPDTGGQRDGSSENMKIAWRYQQQPQYQSNHSGIKFGHYYDLTKTMDSSLIDGIHPTLYDGCTCEDLTTASKEDTVMNPAYQKLLSAVQLEIEKGQFGTSVPGEHRNILRIAIHSLGSPQWGEEGGINDPSLPRFLYALRSLMRTSYGVCMITIPTHLFQDQAQVRRLEHLCDTVCHLDAFVGSDKEKNPAFRQYHGLFNLLKLPRLNSLVCHMPDTLDLAFKLKRKKLLIEKLHLPPELSETASRNQEDMVLPAARGSACGSGGVSTGMGKLDF